MAQDGDNPRRRLPQVQRLLETPAVDALSVEFGRAAVTNALRDTLDDLRAEMSASGLASDVDADAIVARSSLKLLQRRQPGLRRVINATGIVLHTNLGRAPLAAEAIAAVVEAASGYSNLEFALDSGARGSRTASVEPLLCALTGAEAALVVNNGAAAILLALSALASGGDVIVSRGELVEIGGGFRVPDVVRQGGARLVEVGSTNKTRRADYRAAVTPDARVLLKVHQSNFRTIGFTAEVGVADLAALGREAGLMVVVDLGSGLLQRTRGYVEPTVRDALAAGADVVTFSGDKLLGGPQAGLIVGKKDAIDRMRQHPLLRALRLDKMSLAALEATLVLHRDAPERLPVRRMLLQGEAELQARAERLRELVGAGLVEPSEAFAGGGALPEECIVSRALAVDGDAEALAVRLRACAPPVVGRISKGRLLLDVLTVADDELPPLAEALRSVLA